MEQPTPSVDDGRTTPPSTTKAEEGMGERSLPVVQQSAAEAGKSAERQSTPLANEEQRPGTAALLDGRPSTTAGSNNGRMSFDVLPQDTKDSRGWSDAPSWMRPPQLTVSYVAEDDPHLQRELRRFQRVYDPERLGPIKSRAPSRRLGISRATANFVNHMHQVQETVGQRQRSSGPVPAVVPPVELLNWGESAVSGWTLRPRSSLPRGRHGLYPGEQPADACGERGLAAAMDRGRVRANNKDLAVAFSWQHPPRRAPDGRWMLVPAVQPREPRLLTDDGGVYRSPIAADRPPTVGSAYGPTGPAKAPHFGGRVASAAAVGALRVSLAKAPPLPAALRVSPTPPSPAPSSSSRRRREERRPAERPLLLASDEHAGVTCGEFAAAVPVQGVGAQLWRLWKVTGAMTTGGRSMVSPFEGACDTCDKRCAVYLCSHCRKEAYCSVSCQELGWAEHRRSCELARTVLGIQALLQEGQSAFEAGAMTAMTAGPAGQREVRGAYEHAVRCYKQVLRRVHEQYNHNVWQSTCALVNEKDRLLRWLEGRCLGSFACVNLNLGQRARSLKNAEKAAAVAFELNDAVGVQLCDRLVAHLTPHCPPRGRLTPVVPRQSVLHD